MNLFVQLVKPYGIRLLDPFLLNLNNDDIDQFIVQLDSTQNITQDSVELLTAQCSSLLYNAADAAGMIKQRYKQAKIRKRRNQKKIPTHAKNRDGEKTKLTIRYLYHENIS